MPFPIQKLSRHLPLIQKFSNFGEVHDLTSWTFHSIGPTSFEQYLRYFLVMPFLCLIVISKATPSYKNHLALQLCQVDNIPSLSFWRRLHSGLLGPYLVWPSRGPIWSVHQFPHFVTFELLQLFLHSQNPVLSKNFLVSP